jgi:hypothetical protein
LKIFLLLMSLVLQVHAAEAPPAKLIKDIEGVYKRRFTSGIITPGKAPMEDDTPYDAEDIVEIVPYDDTHIYVRAEFQFYNGHSCSISGIAAYENHAFVYHDPEPSFDGSPPCTLAVRRTDKEITFMDRLTPDGPATCKFHCGVRGGLSGISIGRKSKRPIRYIERLKASREYRRAVEDLRKYEESLGARSGQSK